MQPSLASARIFENTKGTLWGYVADKMISYNIIFIGFGTRDFRLINMVKPETKTHHETSPNFMVTSSQQEAEAAEGLTGIRSVAATASDFFFALKQALHGE